MKNKEDPIAVLVDSDEWELLQELRKNYVGYSQNPDLCLIYTMEALLGRNRYSIEKNLPELECMIDRLKEEL